MSHPVLVIGKCNVVECDSSHYRRAYRSHSDDEYNQSTGTRVKACRSRVWCDDHVTSASDTSACYGYLSPDIAKVKEHEVETDLQALDEEIGMF